MYTKKHKMHYFSSTFLLLVFVFQAFLANCCIKHEREALLKFKAGVNDPSNYLVSWSNSECCSWTGVGCSNITGHVVKLDLGIVHSTNNSLSGNISSSLIALSDLVHLDLSNNNFSGNKFPEFISSFRNLSYLSLSNTYLYGIIPPQLGNLSKLQHLDLSHMPYIFISNVWWLSHLTSLTYIDMSGVNFQDSRVWVQALNRLPLLQTLILDGNNLTTIPASITMLNFSSLESLFIYGNNFNSRIPNWIGKLTKLTELQLMDCSFVGPVPNQLGNLTSLNILDLEENYFDDRIPDTIGKLTNLEFLILFDCFFTGRIPNQLGNLTSLKTIGLWENHLQGPMPSLHNLKNLTVLSINDVNIGEDIREVMSKLANEALHKLELLWLWNTGLTGNLTGWLSKMHSITSLRISYNNLTGTIPTEIGNITSLESLSLKKNSFTGEISEIHLTGLSNLMVLELDSNFITIVVDRNWIPLFQLETVTLGGCKLGPQFPSWFQNQSQLTEVNLSNTGIVDNIPNWFWNLPSLSYIDLSHNNISGRLPLSLEHLTNLGVLVLSNNKFEGGVPSLPNSLDYIDLSNNLFSGTLPHNFKSSSVLILALSNNLFGGTIEQLTCGLDSLIILNLAQNNLYGDLPLCWPNTLEVVNMAHNNLSGAIPSSMGSLNFLSVLQLNNNSLTGEVPSTLQFCRNLIVLDIGENNFFGQIPKWIGERLNNLTILRLRSNMFSGEIPIQIMHLTNLQVLDLASNHISGFIPHNMVLLPAMASSTNNRNNSAYLDFLEDNGQYYKVSTLVVMKDSGREYTTTLSLLRSIDLADNNMTGKIPQQIITLHGLINLNLSNNHFHGLIPTQIGEMQLIESLDLSMNELSGMIPESLANLNFLTTLNLSYNNLSGKIPTGNQLQTLDDRYIYIGNDYLCVPPLRKSCNTSETPLTYETKRNDDLDKVLVYFFPVLGFGFGFWLVGGILLFKRKWRYHFFEVVDNWYDMLYVFIMVYSARMSKDITKRICGE